MRTSIMILSILFSLPLEGQLNGEAGEPHWVGPYRESLRRVMMNGGIGFLVLDRGVEQKYLPSNCTGVILLNTESEIEKYAKEEGEVVCARLALFIIDDWRAEAGWEVFLVNCYNYYPIRKIIKTYSFLYHHDSIEWTSGMYEIRTSNLNDNAGTDVQEQQEKQ
jgi:hypothetical protein